MAKISYASLKLKVNDKVKTFDFNENKIEVLQYLPVEDKYDLVSITLQKARENNIYNDLLLDIYFQLHLVYTYTNLTFTEKQRENEMKLYDTLQSNGFFDAMMEVFNEDEYAQLLGYVERQKEDELAYNTTAAALVKSLIQDLPAQAEAMSDILNNFDKEKYQEVINFAKAANGGRAIE